MEIVFIRHGQPDYRLADQRQMSQLEKDYAPLAREHIPFIAQQAKDPIFDGAQVMISSPYTRALQTAELLNRQLQLDLWVEHDVREWCADLAGGYIDLQERDRRWHQYRAHLQAGTQPSNVDYEDAASLKARTLAVLSRYRDADKLVLVAHFNVLESLIGYQNKGIACGEFRLLNSADFL